MYIYIYIHIYICMCSYMLLLPIILVAAVLLRESFYVDFLPKLQEAALAALMAEKAAAEKAGQNGGWGAKHVELQGLLLCRRGYYAGSCDVPNSAGECFSSVRLANIIRCRSCSCKPQRSFEVAAPFIPCGSCCCLLLPRLQRYFVICVSLNSPCLLLLYYTLKILFQSP